MKLQKDDQLVKQGSFVEATLELGRNLVTTAVMAAASAKVMGNENRCCASALCFVGCSTICSGCDGYFLAFNVLILVDPIGDALF
ncbi:hypothetical protein XCY_000646 [Xanthomonas arboricola pv. juglandis]|uniref:hypothetical protein n=1 Tax=Xanthomonas arboricola TaxID=56448 RepID=UPI001AF67C6D|nr:hypothetical protein [Xanthomonas arboricola]CAG2084462.1 hypothetical protein XCY_000646 [Xanthomonas arboricola pv. juglandis]